MIHNLWLIIDFRKTIGPHKYWQCQANWTGSTINGNMKILTMAFKKWRWMDNTLSSFAKQLRHLTKMLIMKPRYIYIIDYFVFVIFEKWFLKNDFWNTIFETRFLKNDFWNTTFETRFLKHNFWNTIFENDFWNTIFENRLLKQDFWKTLKKYLFLKRNITSMH